MIILHAALSREIEGGCELQEISIDLPDDPGIRAIIDQGEEGLQELERQLLPQMVLDDRPWDSIQIQHIEGL